MKKMILALAVVAVLLSPVAFAGGEDSGGPKGTDSTDGGNSKDNPPILITLLQLDKSIDGGADDIGPRDQA